MIAGLEHRRKGSKSRVSIVPILNSGSLEPIGTAPDQRSSGLEAAVFLSMGPRRSLYPYRDLIPGEFPHCVPRLRKASL